MQIFLKDQDIWGIYQRFVFPKYNPNYLNKYENLPLELNNQKWKWEGKDFPRVISLLEFKEFMETRNNPVFKDVLVFNGSVDPEFAYLKCESITNINYTDDPVNYDLNNLNLPKKDFDFIMTNQTLEHVYDPCLVVRNLYNHIKPGGLIYMNLPSMNIPHSTPFHYYAGFTPTGLGAIFQQAGFDIIDIGFWGNKDYNNFIINNNTWPDYTQIPNYKSEKDQESISWIFAVKR